jgi:hypothetical protein
MRDVMPVHVPRFVEMPNGDATPLIIDKENDQVVARVPYHWWRAALVDLLNEHGTDLHKRPNPDDVPW